VFRWFVLTASTGDLKITSTKYNPKKSFFDGMSTDRDTREERRESRQSERANNTETFGTAPLPQEREEERGWRRQVNREKKEEPETTTPYSPMPALVLGEMAQNYKSRHNNRRRGGGGNRNQNNRRY
jgi:hypothetical protein